MANILFIGHEASRSGAPFTQLYLMQWLKQHTQHKMALVLLKGGPLVEEFKQLADVHIVEKSAFSLASRIRNKLIRMSGREHVDTVKWVVKHKPDILFSSSLAGIDYGAMLKEKTGTNFICNIHELSATFHYARPGEYLDGLQKADWLMMGSHAVKEFYLKNFAVDPKKVSVIYDFTGDPPTGETTFADIRKAHNIPATAKIVGGMGSLQWRKGNDLFLAVARRALETSPDTYFVWVGGHTSTPEYKQWEHDVRLAGIADRLVMAGEQKDIQSYYHAFDVFLLTSREDPFPLVCLESAMAGVPVICFENSGGMPEFVRDDAGFVVGYINTDEMAEKTLLLLNDDALRQQKGAVARERAINGHTIGKTGPSVLALIESVWS